jgi:hypothetical protein
VKTRTAQCAACGIAALIFVCASPSFAQPYVELGPSDGIALDQPRVTFKVYATGTEDLIGPDLADSWLLDTGAQGILAASYATSELISGGYITEGTYEEIGIGGTTTYDVSEVYDVYFAGTNTVAHLLPNARIMSSDTANFGGFGGIVGMPAMVNRVTTLDLTPMAQWEYMGVDFGDDTPTDNGHRYNVSLNLVDFPAQGEEPLPTYAPLPFVNAKLRQTTHNQTGSMVLDTGAQMSLMSSQIAFALGLDTDNDGDLEDETDTFIPFTGAGGTYTAPVLQIDRLALATEEGIDIVWTDVSLAVIDIDPAIGGVLGSDLLTSGYLDRLGSGENGYFEQIHFDFTDAENMNGTMVLDLNPEFDNVISPEPATLTLLAFAAIPLLKRKRCK